MGGEGEISTYYAVVLVLASLVYSGYYLYRSTTHDGDPESAYSSSFWGGLRVEVTKALYVCLAYGLLVTTDDISLSWFGLVPVDGWGLVVASTGAVGAVIAILLVQFVAQTAGISDPDWLETALGIVYPTTSREWLGAVFIREPASALRIELVFRGGCLTALVVLTGLADIWFVVPVALMSATLSLSLGGRLTLAHFARDVVTGLVYVLSGSLVAAILAHWGGNVLGTVASHSKIAEKLPLLEPIDT